MGPETQKDVWLRAYLAAATGCYASGSAAMIARVDALAIEAAHIAVRHYKTYSDSVDRMQEPAKVSP